MALFKRRSSGPADSPITPDQLLGHGPAHVAGAAAARGDIAGVTDVLKRAEGTGRSLVLDAIGESVDDGTATRWTQEQPDNPDAWLGLGACLARLASDVRGGGKFTTLSNAQIMGFTELMAAAVPALERAAELDPEDPEPIRFLLTTEFSTHGEHIGVLYDELRRRDPWHVIGLNMVINLLSEKWFGEKGEARALAEQLTADAPVGDVPVVLATALVEQWLYHSHFDEDDDLAEGFLRSRDCASALARVEHASLDAPGFQPSATTLLLHNKLAFLHVKGGRERQSVRHFQAIGDAPSPGPWYYDGGSERIYAELRARAGL